MNYINKTKIILIMLTLIIVNTAQAIVIRHDTADKKYQALASRFNSSITYNDGCVGTVIAPMWVLTAAHCITPEEHRPFFLEHLGNKYPIETIVIHPKFVYQTHEFDLALLQVKWPMVGARKVSLFKGTDEIGKQVTFVGNGDFGNGLTGITSSKPILRAATNIVTDMTNSRIQFVFDEPSTALELEGISGPHDSGGPAFIEKNNQLYIAGVSSWQKNSGIEGVYGVVENYARVSTQTEWIEGQIFNVNQLSELQHPLLMAVKSAETESIKKQLRQYPEWHKNDELTKEIILELIYLSPPRKAQKILAAMPALIHLKINNISLPMYAIEYENWWLFEHMLDLGIKINERNIYGESYLIQLLRQFPEELDFEPLLKKLLTSGLEINARDGRGNTAIAFASYLANRDNKLTRVKMLLEYNANINIGDHEGYTPLMYVASAGNQHLTELFLANGARPHLKDKTGQSALDYAKKHNRKNLLKQLSTWLNN